MGLIEEVVNEVRNQWGIAKKQNPKQPICNLKIELNGWQGNYTDFSSFMSTANKLRILGKFEGEFRLLLDGSLINASPNPMFHSYSATLHLEEVSRLDFEQGFKTRPFRYLGLPHIHLKDNGYIFGSITPDSFGELKPTKLMCSPFSRPHYTLEGLYDSLPNEKMNTKITALQKELLERTGYVFESVALRKDTRLKLLEHQYRRKVSNQ